MTSTIRFVSPLRGESNYAVDCEACCMLVCGQGAMLRDWILTKEYANLYNVNLYMETVQVYTQSQITVNIYTKPKPKPSSWQAVGKLLESCWQAVDKLL